MSRPRLGYLVSHPIQYQAPLFRRLASSPALDFVALFGCAHGAVPSYDPQFGQVVNFGVDVLSGFEHAFVPQAAAAPDVDRFLGLRARRGEAAAMVGRVDQIVLHGWRTAMMWQVAAAARRGGVPYHMRAETPFFAGAGGDATLRRRARDAVVGPLVRGAARTLALGSANERFYRRLGVDARAIVRVPYFVDDAAVRAAACAGRRDRAELRAGLGIPVDAPLVVSVGKLIARKRPFDLADALARLSADVHVAWIGSGELEAAARARAARLGVERRFHVVGFRPAEEVWRLLGAADLFALPAEREPWGLVVNEAVVAGLPVLATDDCGAAEDLVVPGRTGDVVPVGDVDAWAGALDRWVARIRGASGADAADAELMRRLADGHSLERAARAIEGAVLSVSEAA